MTQRVTLRVTSESHSLARELVSAWLNNPEATISVGGYSFDVEITYVKEQ